MRDELSLVSNYLSWGGFGQEGSAAPILDRCKHYAYFHHTIYPQTAVTQAELCEHKRSFFEPPDRVKDGSYYEYIAVYCDDLTIASRDPKAITGALQKKYLFKLKGTGPQK
eukprot:scaffold3594_cov142-Skeletonema_dohrnii-CCMP3373.AAC.5